VASAWNQLDLGLCGASAALLGCGESEFVGSLYGGVEFVESGFGDLFEFGDFSLNLMA